MEGGVVLVFNMCIVIYSRRGLLTFGDSKPFSDFLPRQVFFLILLPRCKFNDIKFTNTKPKWSRVQEVLTSLSILPRVCKDGQLVCLKL